MRSWITNSPDTTRALGTEIVAELTGKGIVLLVGDLGSGKTVLAQGIGAGLGIAAPEVQSPTFTLIREHLGSRGRLVHIDLYRLDPDDVPSLGLEEWLAADAMTVIEWADRLPWAIPADLCLELRRTGTAGERHIREIDHPLQGRSNGEDGG